MTRGKQHDGENFLVEKSHQFCTISHKNFDENFTTKFLCKVLENKFEFPAIIFSPSCCYPLRKIIEMKMIILIREKLHKLDNLSSF